MTFLGAVDFAAIPNESKLRKAKKWPNFYLNYNHVLKIFISKFFRYLRGADKITMQ